MPFKYLLSGDAENFRLRDVENNGKQNIRHHKDGDGI
jgi:hypothetical protein